MGQAYHEIPVHVPYRRCGFAVEGLMMASEDHDKQHAALWLIGPDMPGLLRIGAEFVASRGGNIDRDIADKFGEKAVVFMSVSASPSAIRKMDEDKETLKKNTGCGVLFQPMNEPTVPDGFQEGLFGFEIVTDDATGVIAEITKMLAEIGVVIVGHTGERGAIPGPIRKVRARQKYVIILPHEFDHGDFNYRLTELVKKFKGQMQTPLRPVAGLLWWK